MLPQGHPARNQEQGVSMRPHQHLVYIRRLRRARNITKLSLVKSKCLKYNNFVCIADLSVLCGTSPTILYPTLLAQRRVVHHYALEISYQYYQIYCTNTSSFLKYLLPLPVCIKRTGIGSPTPVHTSLFSFPALSDHTYFPYACTPH